ILTIGSRRPRPQAHRLWPFSFWPMPGVRQAKGRLAGVERSGGGTAIVGYRPCPFSVIVGNLRRRSTYCPDPRPEAAMDNPPVPLTAAQANALAAVIELESLWENIPPAAAQTSASEGWRGLNAKQRAF